MARVDNLIGYDAVNIGNHEFNYGLDTLRRFAADLDSPLLGANVIDRATGKPLTEATTLLDRTVGGHHVKVGVVGVTTPGSLVWDKANIAGKVDITDPVEATSEQASRLRAQGADVVVVLAHTGLDQDGVEPIVNGLPENSATSIARKATGIDLVIDGHTHQDIPSTVVDGASGNKVLISQPNFWARSVSDVRIPLRFDGDAVSVDRSSIDSWATARPTKDVAEDPTVAGDPQLRRAHDATVDYVNTVVATSKEAMSSSEAMVKDSAILDFIGEGQVKAVRKALKGTRYESLPVIAQTSPFSRSAAFPAGDVRIKDLAGLYPFENTLKAVTLNGDQVRDYLEYSARYFTQAEPGATINPAPASEGGNTQNTIDGKTIWDYNYDALTGVRYSLDLSRPVGSRVLGLTWQGHPVTKDMTFVLAVNNYRQSGGGGYPHVAEAPVVADIPQEIRQILIDQATADTVIDPATFHEVNWFLTTTGQTWPAGDATTPTPSTPSTPKAPDTSAPPATSGAPTGPAPTHPGLPATGV